MRIDIRAAETDDIEAMATIVNTVYRDTYSPFLNAATIEKFTDHDRRVEKLNEMFATRIPHFVVLYDGKICGVLTGGKPDKEPPDTIEIVQLYIMKEYRGKRLGKKLLSHALCAYRKLGYKYAVLTAFNKNENAKQFYEHFGFEFLGVREADIGQGIQAAMYRIEL